MLRIRESGADLARATGGVVTRSYVTSLRKGPIENPGKDKLRALASRRWVPLLSGSRRQRSLGAKDEPEVQNGQLSLLGMVLRWFMKSSASYSPRDVLDHLVMLARAFWMPLDHGKDLVPRAGRGTAPEPREGTPEKTRSFPGQGSSAGLVRLA